MTNDADDDDGKKKKDDNDSVNNAERDKDKKVDI